MSYQPYENPMVIGAECSEPPEAFRCGMCNRVVSVGEEYYVDPFGDEICLECNYSEYSQKRIAELD